MSEPHLNVSSDLTASRIVGEQSDAVVIPENVLHRLTVAKPDYHEAGLPNSERKRISMLLTCPADGYCY